MACLIQVAIGQTFTPVGNASYIGLDKNLLFNAAHRYQVTQTGTRQYNLPGLFNGSFQVEYITGFDGNAENEVVIEIAGLPSVHVQVGAFVGFTARALPPKRFKIEGYDVYLGLNEWRTIADVANNTNSTFIAATPKGVFTKLRYTLLESTQSTGTYAGYVGLSEIFFVHNEAAKAYDGLMVQYGSNGNVGIGTNSATEKLSVKGKIRAQEIKVEMANWADFVFAKDYILPTLQETEKHIKEKGHLPGIPSATEVENNGIELGDMNKKLLQKIEELTLYLIRLNKVVNEQSKEIQELKGSQK
ncbi:hypothetical protein [Pedobacter ginsengisoli]|uniref:hypothetical protein n=1 Tax=Pedobacter ginsengisoli TaxID=363852 RepID=UPI00254B1723|nr:hypothetical protein [Pedobacter ginsengisoli]